MLDLAGLAGTANPADIACGRTVGASLRFAHGGGRTFLHRQHVPYPFHITRTHRLDAGHPDVASLILQSASGGLYCGDRLTLDIAAGAGVRAWVTSQAATVVHAAAAPGIAVRTRLEAAPGAVLALATDPYILFPGTALSVHTDIVLGPGATVVLAEGFSSHDPAAAGRPFDRLATRCRVLDGERVLLDEAGAIDGDAFLAPGSPLGAHRAMGTVMLLGVAALHAPGIERELDALGVLGGVTGLPNAAGTCVRMLAGGGGTLSRGLDAVLSAAFTAVFGRQPPQRRR
jgi:urease accessory protein